MVNERPGTGITGHPIFPQGRRTLLNPGIFTFPSYHQPAIIFLRLILPFGHGGYMKDHMRELKDVKDTHDHNSVQRDLSI